ncbi:MAG TPA: DUF1302 family protein [Candidatus Binatia bacterium]|nr:DUF1302 family protein [Candidatus Binatia bacterium]
MRRNRQGRWGLCAAMVMFLVPAATAWGYYFDDRREMSLSGFAYTRATMALKNDNIGTYKGNWQAGNLVQHRNFLTLEWRHNVNRISRDLPTVGPLFQFLNWDAFDYYANPRMEHDGAWDYGPHNADLLQEGGTNHFAKYYGYQAPKFLGQFARYTEFEYQSSLRRIHQNTGVNLRLFEWYFNITKGPLFLRIGRQNLSWGETDGFRLLDQINPLDNNFGGFLTPLDERRIPLNMLRAQWSFGTVGPISDLTLEGFVSVDNKTLARTTVQGSYWTVATNTAPIMINRTPCGDPFFRSRDFPAPGLGTPCSVRAQGPHANVADSRGGARLLGTIHDFTFSIAHYYTWADQTYVQAKLISPTPQHLLWDLNGLGNPALLPATNPWGPNDPTVGLKGPGTPGAFLTFAGQGTPAAIERNLRSAVNSKRIQVTGGSLSFPVNALTGMFVGSDNPLYYIYTTFRSEVAYFRDVPIARVYHDLDSGVAIKRFLTPTVLNSGIPLNQIPLAGALGVDPHFAPGGQYAAEAGSRSGGARVRDVYAWNIGLDHNQWIHFLNPVNTFTFSAQLFWAEALGVRNTFQPGIPAGLTNDRDALAVRPRSAAPKPGAVRIGGPGNRTAECLSPNGNLPPCSFKGLLPFPGSTQVLTFNVGTQYMGGNLRPSFTFFYDWSGSYLLQPGIDWTFWDPFRVSLRLNQIEGHYYGIGFFKTRSNIWLELQYLLY